ncbi:hypothetical protein [Anabaena azotica]|uniref:hypothetical protein n=1 Tax=Anabaena azotica TaxID=197653 RepID=UPI0039A4320C
MQLEIQLDDDSVQKLAYIQEQTNRTYASVTPNIYFMVRQLSNIWLFAGFMKSDAPY